MVRYRLTQKKSQSRFGMVKVICCQVVSGSVLKLFLIQSSVAFFPQDEQNLDLQECGASMLWWHFGQTKKRYPRKRVLPTSTFSTLIMMLVRMRRRCVRKNFHQFPLSRRMSLSLIPLAYSMPDNIQKNPS